MSGEAQQLEEAITQLAELLRSHSEAGWADQLVRDVELIERGDFYGVERFLRKFGGMGSLNDIALAQASIS
jgi:hypothetical protein